MVLEDDLAPIHALPSSSLFRVVVCNDSSTETLLLSLYLNPLVPLALS